MTPGLESIVIAYTETVSDGRREQALGVIHNVLESRIKLVVGNSRTEHSRHVRSSL